MFALVLRVHAPLGGLDRVLFVLYEALSAHCRTAHRAAATAARGATPIDPEALAAVVWGVCAGWPNALDTRRLSLATRGPEHHTCARARSLSWLLRQYPQLE